jgi:hypothetical protein
MYKSGHHRHAGPWPKLKLVHQYLQFSINCIQQQQPPILEPSSYGPVGCGILENIWYSCATASAMAVVNSANDEPTPQTEDKFSQENASVPDSSILQKSESWANGAKGLRFVFVLCVCHCSFHSAYPISHVLLICCCFSGDSYSSVGYDVKCPVPSEQNPLGVQYPGNTWTEGSGKNPNWVSYPVRLILSSLAET